VGGALAFIAMVAGVALIASSKKLSNLIIGGAAILKESERRNLWDSQGRFGVIHFRNEAD
jgi:hypothetical protein